MLKNFDFCLKKLNISHTSELEKLEILCFADEAWSLKSIEDDIKSEEKCVWFGIFCKNEMVGYLNGSFIFDECELNRIAVAPNYRRNGIGEFLIDFFLKEAKKKECQTSFLEVRESNKSAIALYEKKGFLSYGKRKDYYRNPKENAVLMTYEF